LVTDKLGFNPYDDFELSEYKQRSRSVENTPELESLLEDKIFN
jgi:hypothetical protein